MAELITSISRSDTTPIVKPLSVGSSKGRITLDVSSFTPRMFYELPAIRFEIYTETNGTRVKYNTSDNVIKTYHPELFPDCDKLVIPIKNIPEDCYIYITPIFDNEAVAARNMLIENGIESGEMWDNALTQTFPITIGFDVEPGGGGGGGGSATLITKTITVNGEYNASDDNADGYSQVTVDVPDLSKPVFYDATPETGVSVIYGKIVKTGHKVTWTGRVDFTSTTYGDKHIFTLPSELRPYTKYLFKCGSGGAAYDDTGYVLPNGEVHISLGSNKAFTMADMSWDIITPDYTVSVDTSKVTAFSGGLEKIGSLVIMQVSFTFSGIGEGWHSNIFTVPTGVRPTSTQFPFSIYRGRNFAQYPDTNIGTNGACNMYISPSLGTTVDVMCMWEIT
jgi:hypothetical protein